MSTNNTVKVTPALLEKIRGTASAMQAIHDKMDFVQPLTPEQRQTAVRFGPKTVTLTTKRLDAARRHRDALPPSFELRAFEQQTTLLGALDQCRAVAEAILGDIHDTMRVVGPAALEASKAVVAHLAVTADGPGAMAAWADKSDLSQGRKGSFPIRLSPVRRDSTGGWIFRFRDG